MKRSAPAAALAAGLALAVALPSPARAADVSAEAAWARASAGPARNGAAYVILLNRGADAALVGAETPASARAELHGHTRNGDVVRMRRFDSIALPAGGRVTLAPGGAHIMLLGLAAPLEEGSSFPLTLRFDDGDSLAVAVAVGGVAASAAPGDGRRPE